MIGDDPIGQDSLFGEDPAKPAPPSNPFADSKPPVIDTRTPIEQAQVNDGVPSADSVAPVFDTRTPIEQAQTHDGVPSADSAPPADLDTRTPIERLQVNDAVPSAEPAPIAVACSDPDCGMVQGKIDFYRDIWDCRRCQFQTANREVAMARAPSKVLPPEERRRRNPEPEPEPEPDPAPEPEPAPAPDPAPDPAA